MSTADELLEKMYSWIEHREQCAKKLKKLAQELESLRENCNVSECIGTTTAVVGTLSLIGAGVATLLTGGAAAPLLGVVGGVCSAAGVGVSVVTKITEHFMSSDTMKDAQKIESRINETTEEIQNLFEKLRKEKQRGSSSADDLDQRVMSEILKAMARRSGLEPRFIRGIIKKEFRLFRESGPSHRMLNLMVGPMIIPLGSVLSFFTLKARGDLSKVLFVKGGQQLGKEFSKIGLKTALKGGAMAVGGVIGLAFELPEAIDQWEKLISNNHVTTASKSLRDTANDLLKISQTLREQLDEIQQMFKDFEELKSCLENSNRTTQQEQEIMKKIEKYCDNQDFSRWLCKVDKTAVFSQLRTIFYFLKKKLEKEKKKKKETDREIDIVFVAHGCITEPLIPASRLLPSSKIKDVILYSPWNSAINACAAYGIATGNIQPEQRRFYCTSAENCPIPHRGHYPATLPNNWNSMKNAGGLRIPTIWVSPLKIKEKTGEKDESDETYESDDVAWSQVKLIQTKFVELGTNRVVIPYKFPQSFVPIPLDMVMFILSLVLSIFPFKATFHLAACLDRWSETTLSQSIWELNQQYSWAMDHTMMSWQDEVFQRVLSEDSELYEFLRSVFDQ